MENINDGSGIINPKILTCGQGNIGRLSIKTLLEGCSIDEMANFASEARKVGKSLYECQIETLEYLAEELLAEINYEPSIQELKKYLKYEKNPMRQLQLKRDIAKMERENSKK